MPTETPAANADINEDLLHAIDHAIDNEGALPPESTNDDAEGGEGVDSEEGDTDSPGTDDSDGAGDGEGEDGTDGAEGETGADPESRPRNADGTFKSAEQLAAEAAAKPADGKSGKPGEQKKPDAVNDPIPKDLKRETQERIRSLIDTTKEATTRAEATLRDFNFLVEGVQATGTTPEQYGEMLSFMSLLNSNDPTQQTKALELAEDFADRLATLLGKERTVNDPLAAHADLKAAISAGQVTTQWAKEIARQRNQSNFRTELTDNQRAQSESERAYNTELSQSKTDLNALEAHLRTSDPNWEAKKAQLVPILQPIFKTMRPAQRLEAFKQAYQALVFSAPAAKKPAIPANQPMRAGKGNPGGGGAGLDKGATSALEAMEAALSGMGR